METTLAHPLRAAALGGAYAVLRRGGATPAHAGAQLELSPDALRRLETVFRAQAARGAGDSLQPKYARHQAHVAAVMAQGGYPALAERRRGRTGGCASLPLRRPRP